jgi:hypothetical protein
MGKPLRKKLEDWALADIVAAVETSQLVHQPLGFYRFFLSASHANEEGIFLHAWLSIKQSRLHVDPAIHAHTFDMSSKVISGRIQNSTYRAPLFLTVFATTERFEYPETRLKTVS